MENPHASEGMAEDLIRAFVQFGVAEMHLKTLVEKCLAKLENPKPEDGDVLSQMQIYETQLDEVAQLRRRSMIRLMDEFPNGNKEAWCLVKHIGLGAMQIFEAYQATDSDPELFDLWLDANKQFIKALSVFIGIEITDCAACFSDILKGK